MNHDFMQGFLFCALLQFPLWVIIDIIWYIAKKIQNKDNKEDDE